MKPLSTQQWQQSIKAVHDSRLPAHRESLPAEELQRYEAQYKYIRQICALYEDDPGNFGKLFSLIQEVRAARFPCPQELTSCLASPSCLVEMCRAAATSASAVSFWTPWFWGPGCGIVFPGYEFTL